MSVSSEALVVGIEGEYALIEVQNRQTGCGRCHEPGGCGGGLLSQMKPHQERRYRVLNSIQATLGDVVIVTIPDGSLWRASFVAYLLPLLGVLAGAGLGMMASGGGDQGAVLGSIIGLAGGIAGLKVLERRKTGRFLISMRFRQENECAGFVSVGAKHL